YFSDAFYSGWKPACNSPSGLDTPYKGRNELRRNSTHSQIREPVVNMCIGTYRLPHLFALSVTAVFLLFFCGCGGIASTPAPAIQGPLSAANINLIFVVSEDLANNAAGDVNA